MARVERDGLVVIDPSVLASGVGMTLGSGGSNVGCRQRRCKTGQRAAALIGAFRPNLSPMQSPQTQLLSQDVDDEQWNVHSIPPPKTARVGAKAEGPFQPGSLQVSRRLRDDSSVDIERGTDSDQYGRIESVAMRRHPALLLWRAEADPDDIGAGSVNFRDVGLVFCH